MDFFIPDPTPGLQILLANQAIPRYVVVPDPEDQRVATSYLGTPIYDQLTLKYTQAVNTGIIAGVIQTTPKTDSITFQTVLLEITQTKNIVKTGITGTGGTVKEYISDGDFFITVRGAIVSPYANFFPKDAVIGAGGFPKDSVRQLVKMCTISDALEVNSGFLGYFGINSAVIESYHVAEKMGSRNEVPFELFMVSDKPIEFQLG